MSFDIFFQPCRFGQATTEKRDGNTGQTSNILTNEPLTAAELAAVRTVLAKAHAPNADQFGCYCVRFEDGAGAEVFASNLEEGCMVALRGITASHLAFLFDLLQAGNWTMIPAMPDTRAIAASPTSFRHVPKGFPQTVVCESPAELGIMLKDGFGAWKEFRDRIAGTNRQ